MAPDEVFQIELRLNGQQHEDIFVRVGQDQLVGDTYWLAADPNIRPDDHTDAKCQAVFACMLQACLVAARNLEDSGCMYMPLDLQDESVGAVQCRRKGDQMILTLGMLPVSGYLVLPSKLDEIFTGSGHFEATGADVSLPRLQLLALLERYVSEVGPGPNST